MIIIFTNIAFNFFIGKPGPGSLSEAVHMGLPVITFRNTATMPQERYNATWVEENQLGRVIGSVNDLPGALIHLRNALVPGGLVMAHFIGGQSLPALRASMLAAEPERPAARIHPLVDHRAAPGLLQRAGWKDPVVDTHALTVRYAGMDRLVADLRDSGLGNALAKPAAPLGKAALARARDAFAARAEADGKTTETFEIITLTGRRSLAGT